MGRHKGGTNKYWSKEEKYEVIKPLINLERSLSQVAKERSINPGMVHNWYKAFLDNGVDGLNNKTKPGNPLAKYQRKLNLSDMEKLEYENMQLKIENERLKKGYQIKGDGTIVIYKK